MKKIVSYVFLTALIVVTGGWVSCTVVPDCGPGYYWVPYHHHHWHGSHHYHH